MTLKEFINGYNGKYLDWDKKFGNQCVDLFRFYCAFVLDMKIQPAGVKSAKNFYEKFHCDTILMRNFKKIPNTLFFKPREGDVLIWKGKEDGHIAVCSDNNATLKIFNAFSQNDPKYSPCIIKTYTYKNLYGVLRPKTHIETLEDRINYTNIENIDGKLFGFRK